MENVIVANGVSAAEAKKDPNRALLFMNGDTNSASKKKKESPLDYALKLSQVQNPNHTVFTIDYQPYDAQEISAHFKAGADEIIALYPDEARPEYNYAA